MLSAESVVTVPQLVVVVSTMIAAVTGFLSYRATRNRDETTTRQGDRKVALEEFTAIMALKQKITDDLRADNETFEKALASAHQLLEEKEAEIRRLTQRYDETRYDYQTRVFELQRTIESLKEGHHE
jgi:uncharacterized protein YpuA (DUF1002 family)